MLSASLENCLAVIAIVVNVCGFFFVTRQIRQQTLATRGETYAARYALSYEILRMMSSKPHLYSYFNDRKPLEPDAPHLVEVLCCCEMIANYCDITALQRENIPRHVWQKWRFFIRAQLDMSKVLQDFVQQHRDWYSPEFLAILDSKPSAHGQVT